MKTEVKPAAERTACLILTGSNLNLIILNQKFTKIKKKKVDFCGEKTLALFPLAHVRQSEEAPSMCAERVAHASFSPEESQQEKTD